MKKVLVLGGKGFLGKPIMRLLGKQNNIHAQSLSRSEGVNIVNLDQFTEALKRVNPDVIINCAAHVGSIHYVTEFAADVIRDNMHIIINLYEGVRRACPDATIVNPLSNCSYPGDANTHYEPEWQNGPVHNSVLAYGSTRRMMHAFAESYHKQYGIKSINWLVANTYGPGDCTDPNRTHALNGVLIRLIKAMRARDKTFEIWGSGKPVREWTYIGDIARIIVHSLSVDKQTYPINIAQNKAYSIADVTRIAAKTLEYNVTFTFNIAKPDGAPIKILDDRIFRASYPDFAFTPLSKGIAETIVYYKKIL